jgi:hypothetical protein
LLEIIFVCLSNDFEVNHYYIIMKKYFAILLILGFLFPTLPVCAQEGNTKQKKTETVAKRKSKHRKNIKPSETAGLSEEQTKELRKKDIEAKERTVDKNKKVKRLIVDEDLSKTVRNRNIP